MRGVANILKRRFYIVAVVLLLMLNTAKGQYSEYEVKAAYIFNFAKFIEWPQLPEFSSDTISLAIYGDDPFGIILEKTMVGRQVRGKYWKIIRVKQITGKENFNILFISGVGSYEALKIIEKLQGKPTLTIGDEIDRFCELGGMVNFTQQFSTHQFEINNNIAKDSRLIISPKLLVLAKIIAKPDDEF
jgi:hypothetical protein